MMPLWIRASLPSSPPRCGWAFWSVGPPCVAQRVWPMPVVAPGRWSRVERVLEVDELAGALLARDAVGGDQGDARRVVPAVLEAGQALHDDVQGFAVRVRADVSDDSAHGRQPNRRPRSRHGIATGARRGRVSNNGAREPPRERQRRPSLALRRARPRRVGPPAGEPAAEPRRRATSPGCGASASGSTSPRSRRSTSRCRGCSTSTSAPPPGCTASPATSSASARPRRRSSSAWPARWRSASPRPRACSRSCCPAGPGRPEVELVTTDGFLYPNAELERRNLLQRKGFPSPTTGGRCCGSSPR